MSSSRLAFASSVDDIDAYRLLQLPDDIIKRMEAGEPDLQLTIKGRADDDAVICTRDKTYALRSVALSNTLLVVTPAPTDDTKRAEIVINDQISHLLEMTPIVPKVTSRLNSLLKDAELREGNEDDSDGGEEEADNRPAKRRRIVLDDIKDVLQASDAEVAQSITTHRVLTLQGELRPLEQTYLAQILKLLLNEISAQSMSPQAALVDELAVGLQERDVPPDVTRQILAWFGQLAGNQWAADLPSIAREIGVSILSMHGERGVTKTDFFQQWTDAVGDEFASDIQLQLLEGNFIHRDIRAQPEQGELVFLPRSSLPADPGTRFNDLFLVKPTWRSDEIIPYVDDLAVDSKARDRLILKWCRTTTDAQGVSWLTIRAKQV